MMILIAGLIVFFGAHLYSLLRSRNQDRDIKKRLGAGRYRGLYSLVSLAGFIMIVYGFDAARPAPVVYVPPSWGTHVNMALMLPALIALVASQLPTGGISKLLKHPMLVAVKLWAFGHLLANGDLASILTFSSFLVYAVFGRIMLKRRGDIGPRPESVIAPWADITAIVVGLGLYAGLVMGLHEILIGVPVFS